MQPTSNATNIIFFTTNFTPINYQVVINSDLNLLLTHSTFIDKIYMYKSSITNYNNLFKENVKTAKLFYKWLLWLVVIGK